MATSLRRGGSFNSIFIRRSFLNSTVKKIMKIGPHLVYSGFVQALEGSGQIPDNNDAVVVEFYHEEYVA